MLSKLFILAVAIAAVWYGFKLFTRIDQQRREKVAQEKKDAVAGVADTVQCPVCGTYVAAVGAVDCGKSACPY
tara:strand:- start:21 stop:239 length:219 start_codon:yes stop_codon:yes gene_type:complete